MKWGILGGTFDPIHLGHLRCAEEVREAFALDKVFFIPAFLPPHKDDTSISSFEHREQMIRLAIAGDPFFSFSGLEKERGGKSYSIETVEHFLSLHHGDLDIYFILGQDAFALIRTWREWERLLLLCNFVVMTRPGYKEDVLDDILTPDFAGRFSYDGNIGGYREPGGHAIFFPQVSFLDISSSDIRERIRTGKSIRYLVPEAVLQYISEQGCYKK